MMLLTKEELTFLRLIAQKFREGCDWVPMDEVMHALSIDKETYEVLVKTMEGCGVIKEINGSDDNYAAAFAPSPYAEQLCRQMDAEERSVTPPDIVEQIQARFRRNPIIAWGIVILLAATAIVTLANQTIELWSKLFPK